MANDNLFDQMELKKIIHNWKMNGDEKILIFLSDKYKWLLKKYAWKYYSAGFTYEEVESIYLVKLWESLNRFDYNIEGDIEKIFVSYVSVSVEREILRVIRKNRKHKDVLSLEQPIGYNKDGDEMKIEDILGTDEEQLVNDVIAGIKINLVRESLAALTSQEQRIILLRYGLDEVHRKTLEEVAEIMGVSRTTIANQERKALIKMRHPRNAKKLKDFIEE